MRAAPVVEHGQATEADSGEFPEVAPRKRLRRFEIEHHGRYLTCSCQKQLPLLSNDRIKMLLVNRIAEARRTHRFRLIAWVIMPEHMHLLIVPDLPDHPVSEVLRAIKRPVAEAVIRRWRQLDAPILSRLADRQGRCRFWRPGGGYDRNIWSEGELVEKVGYIHLNPVRRGLVRESTDYAWSSARAYEGCEDVRLPVDRLSRVARV